MRKYAYLVLLLAVLLCGCKGNNLIGKWNVSGMELPIPGASITCDITSTDLNLNLAIPSSPIKQKFVATYKVEGETMTTNFNDWVVEGQGAGADAAKKMIDAMKGKILESMNKDPKATIKWTDKDTFTLTNAGDKKIMTFTRAK